MGSAQAEGRMREASLRECTNTKIGSPRTGAPCGRPVGPFNMPKDEGVVAFVLCRASFAFGLSSLNTTQL